MNRIIEYINNLRPSSQDNAMKGVKVFVHIDLNNNHTSFQNFLQNFGILFSRGFY